MSDLQKDLVKNVAIFFLSIFGIVGLLYLCATYEIVGVVVLCGVVGGLALFIVGGIFYSIISILFKDFKIRGVLSKEEYEFYNLYSDPRNFIWTCEDENNEYDRIVKLLKEHNVKL